MPHQKFFSAFKRIAAAFCLISAVAVNTAAAAAPEWWTSPQPIFSGAPKDDAAATQGQVMYMAAKARERLEIVLEPFGGAKDEINQLFTGYDPAHNSTPATVGQVKFAASKFWKRLQQAGAPGIPVAPAWPYQRNGAMIWTQDQSDDADETLATLGQVKMAFSFDIPANAPPLQDYATGPGFSGRFWNPVMSGTLVASGIIAGDVPKTLFYHFEKEVTLKPGTQVTFGTVGGVGPFVRTGTLGIDMPLDYGEGKTVNLMAGTTFSFTTVTVGTENRSFVATGTLAADQPLDYSSGTAATFKKGTNIFFVQAESLVMQFVDSGTLASDQPLYYDYTRTPVTIQGDSVVTFVHFGDGGYVSKGVLAAATAEHDLYYGATNSLKFKPGSNIVFKHSYINTGLGAGGYVSSGIAGEEKPVVYSSYPADPFVIRTGSPVTFDHRSGGGNSLWGYLISGVLHSNGGAAPSSSQLPYTYGDTVNVQSGSFVTFRHFGAGPAASGLVESATLDVDQDLDYSYDSSTNQGIKIRAKAGTSVRFEFISSSTDWGFVRSCTAAVDSTVKFGGQPGATVLILAGKTAQFSRQTNPAYEGYLDSATLAPASPPGGVELPYTPGSPPLTAFFTRGTPVSFSRVSPSNSTGFASRGILYGDQEIVIPGSGTPMNAQPGAILQATPTSVAVQNIDFPQDDFDGDGIPNQFDPDPGEFTDPQREGDPSQFPAELQDKTLVLVGDGKMGVEKQEFKVVMIPPGSTYMLVLAVKSEEFPYYTSIQSQWNDELSAYYNIDGAITTDLNVNTLHSSWMNNLNRTFLGYGPVDIRVLTYVTADPDHWKVVSLGLTIKNISDDILPTTGILSLLPVDLDIVHPAKGELDDSKDDTGDGGYVSVQRLEDPATATSDAAPKTKLLVHAISGAQATWKTRLKFTKADRYKLYRDEARTQEVVSESTEFPPNADTTLWFHGLKKSLTRGGESVTMQVNTNGTWIDGDSVKCTIVQSEFLFQVKAFIPYAWSEAENFAPAPVNPLFGKVVKGDLHPGAGSRPASPGFINLYSTDKDGATDPPHELFQNAPFRLCQTVIVTPYEELHSTEDIVGKRKLMTAPLSEHYVKATGVDPTEMTLINGYKALLPAGFAESGKPPASAESYEGLSRDGGRRLVDLTIEGAGKDGAMPALIMPWVDPIHWRLELTVSCETDPLMPRAYVDGNHTSYPSYEVIVLQSDGSFMNLVRFSPPPERLPGPESLDPDNEIPVIQNGNNVVITK